MSIPETESLRYTMVDVYTGRGKIIRGITDAELDMFRRIDNTMKTYDVKRDESFSTIRYVEGETSVKIGQPVRPEEIVKIITQETKDFNGKVKDLKELGEDLREYCEFFKTDGGDSLIPAVIVEEALVTLSAYFNGITDGIRAGSSITSAIINPIL
jgi:hypothetical protein